jgi:RNA polymerase primary sigma factor
MSGTNVTGARPLSLVLKMAVMAGVESAVRIHVQRGDDLNARDSNGLTPLMLSATRNKSAICKLLLDAGADYGLSDPSGKTALAIAVAMGAHETAVILESAIARNRCLENVVPSEARPSDSPLLPLNVQTTESPTELIAVTAIEADWALCTSQVEVEGRIRPRDTSDFDLLGWEPDEDGIPPEADSSVVEAATAIQVAITGYEPFDSSADWDDIDAYLPERALPLARTDDTEVREQLRLLLLRAVREASVPYLDVEALSFNEDRSANPEAEVLLSMVINDLGAEVDERFEYADVYPVGQVKFLHLWPGQIPPGGTAPIVG